MPNRFAIAIRVWLAGIVFAGAAAIAGFVIFAVGTGFANPDNTLSYITLTVLPFLATAGAAQATAAYVTRASNGAFHSGPMVLGLIAGFIVGAIVGFTIDEIFGVITAGVAGPILGAMLGTRATLAVPPLAAGVVSAALGLLFTYSATHP